MVIDTLENFGKYVSLNPLFGQVANFISTHDLASLEPGKYELAGADLYVNVTSAKGKDPSDAVLETHVRMIDVQIPISTVETYGFTPLSALPEAEYNADKDIAKYGDLSAESYVTCQPGMFAIFFPQDGHAPCISMEPEIKKIIFKVKA